MQKSDVVQRIATMYQSMSPSQQRIADVIVKDPENAAFLSVAHLARQSHVSDSTVTRFATFLGYAGYPELTQQLQAMVRSRLTTRERLEKSHTSPHQDPEMVYYDYLEDDVENIKLLVHHLQPSTLHHAVEMLDKAEKIGIICSRSAVSLGLFFDFYLNILGKHPILMNGEPRTTDQFHHLTSSDVVVGIGFSRYSRFTLKGLAYSKNAGIPCIAITDYPSSPLAQHADVTLFCPTGIASHMDSFVAPLALIQAILRSLTAKYSSSVMENLKNLETIWEQLDVYVPQGDEPDIT